MIPMTLIYGLNYSWIGCVGVWSHPYTKLWNVEFEEGPKHRIVDTQSYVRCEVGTLCRRYFNAGCFFETSPSYTSAIWTPCHAQF